jgi:hypothetical protein
MPLDLSGFVTPDQNFEGLQKVGEQVAASNLYQQKLSAAKKKSTDNYGAISPFIELKQYDTDQLYNTQVGEKVAEIKKKGMRMFAEGKTEDEVKFALEDDRNQLLGYKKNVDAIKDAEKVIDEKAKNNPGFDAATAKVNLRKKMFYNDDGTLRKIEEVPADFEQVAGEVLNGPGVYNRTGFNALVSSGKGGVSEKTVVKKTDKTGKSTTQEVVTNAPKGFMLEENAKGEDEWVPEYEKVTLVDNKNAPRQDVASLMNGLMGNNKGKSTEIRMIPNDTYKAYQGIDGVTGYLNSKAKEFEAQAQAQNIPITPDDIENYKKAVAYNELDLSQNIVGKFTKGNVDVTKQPKIVVNTGGGKKTEGEKKYEYLKERIHKSLDEQPLNSDGTIDISNQFVGLNYHDQPYNTFTSKMGGSMTYNPVTKMVHITTKKGSEDVSFDTFYSTIFGENENKDLSKIQAIGEYNRKGKYNKKK